MARSAMVFFGRRSVAIPLPLLGLSALALVFALGVTAVDVAAPRMFGTRPVFAFPEPLQTVLAVITWIAAVIGLLTAIMFLLGWQERRMSDRRFAAHKALVPFTDGALLRSGIAPNVRPEQRTAIATRLRQFLDSGVLTSVHLPTYRTEDLDDGPVDRIFVSTSLDARALRRAIASLRCDEVARVPARHCPRLARETGAKAGTIWLLVWD